MFESRVMFGLPSPGVRRLAVWGVFFTLGSCWVAPSSGRRLLSRLRAVAEPPVRTRPPDVALNTDVGRSEWTECLIKNPEATGNGEANLRLETWIFRSQDYSDFGHFLKIRGSRTRDSKRRLTAAIGRLMPKLSARNACGCCAVVITVIWASLFRPIHRKMRYRNGVELKHDRTSNCCCGVCLTAILGCSYFHS